MTVPSVSWIMTDTDGIEFQQEMSETKFYTAILLYINIHIMEAFPCSWHIL